MAEKDVSDPKVGVALVLTCMDLRVLDEASAYLHHHGLKNEYDHIVMAGAALGVLKKPETWGQTFWDHLGLAIKLHKIDEVYIFEHQDCGAYRLLLETDLQEALDDDAQEKATHHRQALELKRQIEARFPAIKKVELRYIALHYGSVEGEVETF